MINIALKVIPKPDEGSYTIINLTDPSKLPFIKGNGDTNYVCGTCNTILIKSVVKGQIQNIVFCCPKCQSYNIVIGI